MKQTLLQQRSIYFQKPSKSHRLPLMKKLVICISAVAVLAALAWLTFGFFGIQALFTDNEVKEEIPKAVSELIANPEESGPDQILLGKGSFTQGDSTYTITGNAYLSRFEGTLNLTLTDFEVSNGPDLYIYAVKTSSTDNKTVKETVANLDFINLGKLKGNIGSQNYELETEINPTDYQVITIWCQRFSRNFGSALLAADTTSSE